MALLGAAQPDDPGTLAWWIVDFDTVVLGRGSSVAADRAACAEAGVTVVRRSSGGGPVLWGPDLLALDVVIPKGHPLHADDIVASYRWLGEALARAIVHLDVPARAVEPPSARGNGDAMGALACYASLSPWEVVVGNRKVVGLSQVRRRTGTLLQAGIVMSLDTDRLPGLLELDDDVRRALADTLAKRATGLRDHAALDRDQVIAAVESTIAP